MYQHLGKRILDLVLASLLLVVALPLMVCIALVIRLSSRGPVLLIQQRVGRAGEMFDFYKFRSMYVDQEKWVDSTDVNAGKQRGVLFKCPEDPRITPVGRWIRKTSVDELPQLLNVLRGDMSMVGPRPLFPFMLDPYPTTSQRRHTLRPGITGLWQINNRENNNSLNDMASYDLAYVERVSLSLDLMILLKTPFKLMSGAH